MKLEWNKESLLSDKRLRESTVDKDSLDGRTAYENDSTRILNSSPFRRMQDKTQVFPLDNNDFVRTRLTHSLEVASIAKSIGASIEDILLEKKYMDKEDKGSIKTILSNAGILHDMGNTPFGHFGEKAIQDFFIKFFNDSKSEYKDIISQFTKEQIEDLKNFDGNAQLLRLITKLEYIYEPMGLNLTSATLCSIIKYPCSSTEGNKDGNNITIKKFGYLQSEKEIFVNIMKNIYGEHDIEEHNIIRHPLVYILEAADDIAYSTADIEDGIKKGVITPLEVESKIKDFFKNKENKDIDELLKVFSRPNEDNYPLDEERKITQFKINAQSYMIKETIEAFDDNYDDIMSGKYNKDLLLNSKAGELRECFKEISKMIFEDKNVLKAEIIGYEVVTYLLDTFINMVLESEEKWKEENQKGTNPPIYSNSKSKNGKLYKLLSENYAFIYTNCSDGTMYDKFLLVTDYISGMTDFFALNLYKELKGIKLTGKE